MGRLTSILPAFAIAATLAAATRVAIAAPPAPTPRAGLTAVQRRYLALARAGVAAAEQRWRDRRTGWYDARLGDHERYPLATIWDIVPLFEWANALRPPLHVTSMWRVDHPEMLRIRRIWM